MEENNKNTGTAMSIASLVLGIISIVSFLFWYITLPAGILAIVFGVKGIKKTGKSARKSRSYNRNNWTIIIWTCIY